MFSSAFRHKSGQCDSLGLRRVLISAAVSGLSPLLPSSSVRWLPGIRPSARVHVRLDRDVRQAAQNEHFVLGRIRVLPNIGQQSRSHRASDASVDPRPLAATSKPRRSGTSSSLRSYRLRRAQPLASTTVLGLCNRPQPAATGRSRPLPAAVRRDAHNSASWGSREKAARARRGSRRGSWQRFRAASNCCGRSSKSWPMAVRGARPSWSRPWLTWSEWMRPAGNCDPSGQTILFNRIGWAKTCLVKAGLIEQPAPSSIVVTEAGRAVLKTVDGPPDREFLREHCAGFAIWLADM